MADLISMSPFDGVALPMSGGGISVHARTGLAIATVMARKAKAGALAVEIEQTFGLTLPAGPHWKDHNGLALLGTGPDRWLAVHSAPPAGFVADLARRLDGLASVVDQSGAYGVLRLSGPALITTLAKGVAIDLDDRAFPTGGVAVTQVAHVGVTLWRTNDSPAIDAMIARSLCGSFAHWLSAAAGSSPD